MSTIKLNAYGLGDPSIVCTGFEKSDYLHYDQQKFSNYS